LDPAGPVENGDPLTWLRAPSGALIEYPERLSDPKFVTYVKKFGATGCVLYGSPGNVLVAGKMVCALAVEIARANKIAMQAQPLRLRGVIAFLFFPDNCSSQYESL
jgi:hypothetical protein